MLPKIAVSATIVSFLSDFFAKISHSETPATGHFRFSRLFRATVYPPPSPLLRAFGAPNGAPAARPQARCARPHRLRSRAPNTENVPGSAMGGALARTAG